MMTKGRFIVIDDIERKHEKLWAIKIQVDAAPAVLSDDVDVKVATHARSARWLLYPPANELEQLEPI
jgi:hypothetical protein